jgi:pancreatic lipase-related protein 1
LLSLFTAGLNRQTFHVAGFSLGAQFAGYVARNVNVTSGGSTKLERVVGLEPAVDSPIKLSESDATFVMTVHTGNSFSDVTILGHVAFYPNGGLKQPMCRKKIWIIFYDDAICSHGQVQQYWAEAVSSSATSFPARPCSDDLDFYNNLCNATTPIGYMNPTASNTLTGKYFLSTNLNSPYSKQTASP